jgi:hypothetical protein
MNTEFLPHTFRDRWSRALRDAEAPSPNTPPLLALAPNLTLSPTPTPPSAPTPLDSARLAEAEVTSREFRGGIRRKRRIKSKSTSKEPRPAASPRSRARSTLFPPVP